MADGNRILYDAGSQSIYASSHLGVLMGLSTAVRRSYRYFLPRWLFSPRQLVPQLYVPVVFYAIGLNTGMYSFASASESRHITERFSVVMVSLLALRWWAGGPDREQSPKA